MKDRVTLTIERSLLRQIDASVDGTAVKNRSHAVELLLHKALDGDMPRHAVILGGGTQEQESRVLQDVEGVPSIEQNVRMLAEAGINHIIIVAQDVDTIRGIVGDGSRYDARIQYLRETTPMGTGGALHLAKPYLDGPFVVTNGDNVKHVNIRDIYQFHRAHAGWCTLALTTVPDPTQYGVALLNGNRIITFVEKPSAEHAPSNLISAGFYVLEPDVLDLVPKGYAKMEYDIFPKLAKEDKLYGYHFSGEFNDTQ